MSGSSGDRLPPRPRRRWRRGVLVEEEYDELVEEDEESYYEYEAPMSGAAGLAEGAAVGVASATDEYYE